jgi:diamine N-acetyltransferase
MEKTKFVEGEKIYLRPFQSEDSALVYFGKNDEQIRETLFLFAPQTLEQVQDEMKQWSTNSSFALFTICRKEDDVAVGQTALVRIDFVSRAATFYLAIYSPEFWSKGYGGEAAKMMLDYAFDILNLNRVLLHVCAENKNAVAAYKKAGYVMEGTLREAMYHHNRYVDFYVMSVLREEYYAKK